MHFWRAILLAVLGILLLLAAFLVPAYLRALDAAVVARAGEGTPTLLVEAAQGTRLDQVDVAQLLVAAAERCGVPGGQEAVQAVEQLLNSRGGQRGWGTPTSYLAQVLSLGGGSLEVEGHTAIDAVLPEGNRAAVLNFLQRSQRVDVRELLKVRALTTTRIFPPVGSPSGQALDAALLVTALLLESNRTQPKLRLEIEEMAAAANRGHDSLPLEGVLLNINSLAKRLNWDQLGAFIQWIGSTATLRELSRATTSAPGDLPVLFAAAHLARSGDRVADYLRRFPDEGPGNLRYALRHGQGSLALLLRRQQPVYYADVRAPLLRLPGMAAVFAPLVDLALQARAMAVLLKYLLWFDSAFCLARAVWHWRLARAHEERAPELRALGTLRQQTVAALFVVLVIVFGEPYLVQARGPSNEPVLWQPPAAAAATDQPAPPKTESMNTEMTWLSIGVFFLVQLTIYALALIKLREIRREPVPSDLKLRLLDNEEHLFDAGLYVGLGGTVLALVLLALEILQTSLMVAYVSTLFGILFVSILKIFHVRPYRRVLLMESANAVE